MRWREPITERINVTEARRTWSDLLNRVFRREARFIVEKSGIPVAAIISMEELAFFERLKARRDAQFKIVDEMREAFKDVPVEELEREVAKALAEVRAENRARERAERFAALDASQTAFRDVPDDELEREIDRAVAEAHRARHEQAG